MSNEISTTNPNAGLATFGAGQFANDTAFDQLVRSPYMARVQLCGGNNDMAKEGKIGVGRFAFIRNKEDFVDLLNEFQFYPLCYRFAAMRFKTGAVEQYFDPSSDEFKQVQIDSEETDSKAAYGPQFMIWVPAVRDFASFLFGSKSARPEGRKMKQLLDAHSAGTMRSRLVSNVDYKWHVPVIIPYTSAIEGFDEDVARTLAEKFMNPGDKVTEADFDPQAKDTAAPAAAGARAR